MADQPHEASCERESRERSVAELIAALGGRERRGVLFGLFVMALGGAALEAVGVGLVFPLIAVIQEPEAIARLPWLATLHEFVGSPSPRALIIGLALGMVGIFVLKALYMTFLHHVELRILAEWRVETGARLMRSYLSAPHAESTRLNSADPIRTIGKLLPKLFDGFLRASLAFVVNSVAAIALIGVAIMVEPLVIFAAAGVLLLLRAQKSVLGMRLRRLGEDHSHILKTRQRTLQETFAGLKEARVLGREDFFRRSFVEVDRRHADNRRRFLFVSSVQPHLTEMLFAGSVLLIIVGVLAAARSPDATLNSLAVLAAASFRLAPLAMRVLVALNTITYGRHAAETVVRVLERADERRKPVASRSTGFGELRLETVSFRYPESPLPTLREVSLAIRAGECVGLIGASGVGKSTLGDILLGLLEPSAGGISIDGEPVSGAAIRDHLTVGYVSQHVFIADTTVRRNVALAVADEEIDDEAVWAALGQAQLASHVAALPLGVDTVLGENGARISAGQRQRIGLARALYRQPGFLVLDEMSAALDAETERAVVGTIAALKGGTTILVIAHKWSALLACDRIMLLEDGRLRGLNTAEVTSIRRGFHSTREQVG